MVKNNQMLILLLYCLYLILLLIAKGPLLLCILWGKNINNNQMEGSIFDANFIYHQAFKQPIFQTPNVEPNVLLSRVRIKWFYENADFGNFKVASRNNKKTKFLVRQKCRLLVIVPPSSNFFCFKL